MFVSGGITKKGLSKRKVYPCEVCSLKLMVDSVITFFGCVFILYLTVLKL